jgi:hypothetical protein
LILFVILNNNIEKKFLETVVAKDFDSVSAYVDKKYGIEAITIGQAITYDTKGNLVSIHTSDVIKEEYKTK